MDFFVLFMLTALFLGPLVTMALRATGLQESEKDEQRQIERRRQADIICSRIDEIQTTTRRQDPHGILDELATASGWLSLSAEGSLISDAVRFILNAEDEGTPSSLREASFMRQQLKTKLHLTDQQFADHADQIREMRDAVLRQVEATRQRIEDLALDRQTPSH